MDVSDSESVASNSTFDDSYYDPPSELSYVSRLPLHNYLSEADQFIKSHDEITIENALELNLKYRQFLEELRTKFERLLTDIQDKYASNEQLLEKLRTQPQAKAGSSRMNSIYIAGAPYFKDKHLGPSPHNMDYYYRRDTLKEFFPFDFFSQPKRQWTRQDKIDIVSGVKEQLINWINQKKSCDISEIRNKGAVSRSTTKKIADIRGGSADLSKKKLIEIWNMVVTTDDCDFVIDWNKMAFKNLDSRHTPTECEAMWKHYLMPGLNHDAWTKTEDELLMNAAISNNYQDWNNIAKTVTNRSPLQCFIHYRITLSESAQVKKNEKFSQFEDKQLIELVNQHRVGDIINWSKVCMQMPGRNRYQCYHRYMFTLKPGIKKERFTEDEDCIIMAYVQVHGENFGNLPPNLLPGRTAVQVRNRYINTLSHKGNNTWTHEEDEKLMALSKTLGTNWSQISKLLKTKTRFACRCRYHTILKFLDRHPNATIRDVPSKHKNRSTEVTKDNWLEVANQKNALKDKGFGLTVKKKSVKKKIKTEQGYETVTEEVSEPIPALIPQRKSFVERLDKASIPLYEYLKYSYNWPFGRKPRRQPHELTEAEIIRSYVQLQILDFELNRIDFPHRFNSMPQRAQNHLALALHVQPSYQLQEEIRLGKMFGIQFPPSWNTIIGFRAIQMMASTISSDVLAVDRPNLSNYLHPLILFKRRFVQMFYWTALLSKLDPKLVASYWQKINQPQENVTEVFVEDDSNLVTQPKEEGEDYVCFETTVVEDDIEFEAETKVEEEEDDEDEEDAIEFLLNHAKTIQNTREKLDLDENAEVFDLTCTDDSENKVEEDQEEEEYEVDLLTPDKPAQEKPSKRLKLEPSMPLT